MFLKRCFYVFIFIWFLCFRRWCASGFSCRNVSRIGPFSLSLRFGLSAEQLQLRLRTCFHSTRSGLLSKKPVSIPGPSSALFRLLKTARMFRLKIASIVSLFRRCFIFCGPVSLCLPGASLLLLKKKPPKITSLFLIMQTIYRFLFTTVSRLQKAQSAKRSSTVLSICTKADAQYLDSENAVTLLFTV